MKAVVFLGPTLPQDQAREMLPTAIYRGPATQGDLLGAAIEDRADLIGLIDGNFHQTLSVWHSEVCYILSRGVSVFGASSMGALRAVETERYGTVGVGTVFQWYRDHRITADDEVALIHGPEDAGYPSLSLVLVNIRASLYSAVEKGRIGPEIADQVIDIVRTIHYPERNLATIMQTCSEAQIAPDALTVVARALTSDHVDIKAADAREMLKFMRDVVDGVTPRPLLIPFEFNRSGVFEALYNVDRQITIDGERLPLQAIREFAALHRPEYETLHRSALNRSIVGYFANMLGLIASAEELARERAVLFRRLRLDSEDAVEDWLRTVGMSEADLMALLAEEALGVRLRKWILGARGLDRGTRAILDEARIQEVFHEWARAAIDARDVAEAYRYRPLYEDVGQKEPGYLAAVHHANTKVRIDGDVREWAEEAGFEDMQDVVDALKQSYIYYDVEARIARQMVAMERAAEASSVDGASQDKGSR